MTSEEKEYKVKKDYNTRRPQLVIPEYGRNIQKMVEFALTIEDKEERNQVAHEIINVMGQVNPHLRDVSDFKHKLWDHLHIISGFKLDVDSPYTPPSPEKIAERPKKLDYRNNRIRYKHYGKILENLIKKATELEKGDERDALVEIIINLMKKNYLNWNRNSVHDKMIIEDLKELSGGKLEPKPEKLDISSTSDILARTKSKRKRSGKHHKSNHKRRRNK